MKATRQHSGPSGAGATAHQGRGAPETVARARLGHRILWGWLRLILGIAQLVFPVAAIAAFLHGGASSTAVACFLIGSAATLLSRYLYRGRGKPDDR